MVPSAERAVRPANAATASPPKLTPLPLWRALLIFGIPGAIIYLLTHVVAPPLTARGFPLIVSWTLAVVGTTLVTALTIIYLYFRQPGTNWRTFQTRFRLRPLCRNDWLSILIAPVLILILNFALAPTIPWLRQFAFFAPSPVTPELFANAYETTSAGAANATFMGVTLDANHRWLLLYWLLWPLAAIGEELVWRGYCLPRQELNYGRWAWLVNGLLWNFPFHAYVAFNLFSDLPLYLILPLVVQWTQNTWVGIIIHVLLVSLAYAILIPGVLG